MATDTQTLKAQKSRQVEALLAQYEAGEYTTKKTAIIKAGLALVLEHLAESGGGLAANASGSNDHAGGGTYGPGTDDKGEDV